MSQVSNKPPERPRLREPREEREPRGTVVPLEQMRMFAQLFSRDDEVGGYATALASRGPACAAAKIEALVEQLAPRIMACAQWPLQAVLYLPRLGRINASVRREQGAWNVELDAQEDATVRWLNGVRRQCEGRLAAALGAPVNLHLPNAGPA